MSNNTMNELTDQWKNFMPTVKFNKNGYEIRAQILEIAASHSWQDYEAKVGEFKTSVKKEGDTVVTTVEMPEVPTVDTILENAQKFYNFVNQKT